MLALLAAVGQLAVTVVAPLAEGRSGPSAAAHVEQSGTAQHFAHNEADCVACAATGQTPVPLSGRPAPPLARVRALADSTDDRVVGEQRNFVRSPRAPPSLS